MNSVFIRAMVSSSFPEHLGTYFLLTIRQCVLKTLVKHHYIKKERDPVFFYVLKNSGIVDPSFWREVEVQMGICSNFDSYVSYFPQYYLYSCPPH